MPSVKLVFKTNKRSSSLASEIADLNSQIINLPFANYFSSTKMDPNDPRWLGAWWIGFLVCFVSIWPLIIPFSCFPKYLPGKHLTIMGYIGREICFIFGLQTAGLSDRFLFLFIS